MPTMSPLNRLRSITPSRSRKNKKYSADDMFSNAAAAAKAPVPYANSKYSASVVARSRPASHASDLGSDVSLSSVGLDVDGPAASPTVPTARVFDPDRYHTSYRPVQQRVPEPSLAAFQVDDDSDTEQQTPARYNHGPEPVSDSPRVRRELYDLRSSLESGTDDTDATSVNMPGLQARGPVDKTALEPVLEDDPASYDLVVPAKDTDESNTYSLESRSGQIFGADHLRTIFSEPKYLLKFTTFLGRYRPDSVAVLIYYLDALKALAAIKYANVVAEALEPLGAHSFTQQAAPATANGELEAKAQLAFDALVREDLPAFVTYTWINVVSLSIRTRIAGTMPPHLREVSEGLAEVFCLTDPSRADNPIVFASEEFHRTTQYGVGYVMARNCRFLQGPQTDPHAVRRVREAIAAGRDHCETFINYRRDGSPFMNLLMMAPLRDSRGTLRYFIGAQIDVSGLAKECADLPAMEKLLENNQAAGQATEPKDEFQELVEMFNGAELELVRKCGGNMHKEHVDDDAASTKGQWQRPRLLLKNHSSEDHFTELREDRPADASTRSTLHGKLIGVYQHYLLVRPYPSLRILFASPSLRVPGMLQSPFLSRIGSSDRVREELTLALAEGRGVTAKVRWVGRNDDEGRNRWIHCTPLTGANGQIGVWMVVLVDDETSRLVRRFREAPPVKDVGPRADGALTGAGSRTGSGLGLAGRTASLGGRATQLGRQELSAVA